MNFKIFSGNSVLTPQDKKQRLMLIILMVAVLTALIILYFGFWHSSTPSSSSEEIPGEETFDAEMILVSIMEEKNAAPSVVIKKINFDADFLENPYLRNLKIYGEWPLSAEEKGRANPFLPY